MPLYRRNSFALSNDDVIEMSGLTLGGEKLKSPVGAKPK